MLIFPAEKKRKENQKTHKQQSSLLCQNMKTFLLITFSEGIRSSIWRDSKKLEL